MNPNEIGRLAHAINDLRPDWPISSLTTFITRQLASRTYRDATVALAWIATDTKLDGTHASDTPKRVLEAGPWWRAAAVENPETLRAHPPKREEACPICGGYLGACPCQRAPRAYDEDTAPTPQRPHPASEEAKAAAIAAARAEMVRAVGGLETEQGETEESDHE